MSAEQPVRTEIRFTKDPRLIAGVRSAVEHMGQMDGLGEAERLALAKAAELACQKACALGSNGDLCRVAVENFGDRIEISVDYPGKALPFAENETQAKRGFDEARIESRNGHSCLKIVKRCARKPAHP